MNHFHVAAGILCDTSGRVLITERLCDGPFNGLWEFPGGKIADGEQALEALRRELTEELGIEVAEASAYMQLHHEYADRTVDLVFYLVTRWKGEPSGLEGQGVRWIYPYEIDADALLPADEPVLAALQAMSV